MYSFMYGAVNSQVCLRRGSNYCQPIGGQSVIGTVRPRNASDSYILATASIDATSLFHQLAYGADADASGFIVLLAAAAALRRAPNVTSLPQNIMFALFNAERFGYAGSAQMASSLQAGSFPSPAMSLSSITAIVDLEQLALRGPQPASPTPLYVHVDTQAPPAAAQVAAVLRAQGAASGVVIDAATAATPPKGLPPGSAQAFLYCNRSIPAVLLADHDGAFANLYVRRAGPASRRGPLSC